jgi:hypothetical protein
MVLLKRIKRSKKVQQASLRSLLTSSKMLSKHFPRKRRSVVVVLKANQVPLDKPTLLHKTKQHRWLK